MGRLSRRFGRVSGPAGGVAVRRPGIPAAAMAMPARCGSRALVRSSAKQRSASLETGASTDVHDTAMTVHDPGGRAGRPRETLGNEPAGEETPALALCCASGLQVGSNSIAGCRCWRSGGGRWSVVGVDGGPNRRHAAFELPSTRHRSTHARSHHGVGEAMERAAAVSRVCSRLALASAA